MVYGIAVTKYIWKVLKNRSIEIYSNEIRIRRELPVVNSRRGFSKGTVRDRRGFMPPQLKTKTNTSLSIFSLGG